MFHTFEVSEHRRGNMSKRRKRHVKKAQPPPAPRKLVKPKKITRKTKAKRKLVFKSGAIKG